MAQASRWLGRASTILRQIHAATPQKKYDVVVWGCTGFTGRLITEYIAKHGGAALKWGIVGRNADALQGVKTAVKSAAGQCDADVFTVDVSNQAAVDGVIGQTRVVICAAGPFILCGVPIVDACVRLGTDYVDITGETPYVKRLIDKYHAEAVKKNVLIVNMCGFDSIPSDLGTWMIVNAIKEKYHEGTAQVTCFAKMKGSLSGGTVATGIAMETIDPDVAKQAKDPFLLGAAQCAPPQPDVTEAAFAKEINGWTAPFMMAPINTRVVRRSSMLHALAGNPYGANFKYSEVMVANDEASARRLAGSLPDAKVRQAMVNKGVLPKPGQGPSAEERARSWFEFTLIGASDSGREVRGIVKGADPGYGETSKMVSEAALLLLTARAGLPCSGGVVPPSVAFGQALIDRLNARGITFSVAK